MDKSLGQVWILVKSGLRDQQGNAFPISPQKRGQSPKAPTLVPLRACVQWPGKEGFEERDNKVWCDAQLDDSCIGSMYSGEMLVYEGGQYPMYTLQNLQDEARRKIPSSKNSTPPQRDPAPPRPPNTAPPKPPNPPRAATQDSPGLRKQAVLLMHKEAYEAAKQIEPESATAAVGLARSMIVGWMVNAALWKAFLEKARNLKDASPDWPEQQEKLRETEQRVAPHDPTGDEIPF